MLKATLITLLLISIVDAVVFHGYYRLHAFQTAAAFITHVGALDWAGFLT
jgi:hypothetical protein